MNTKSYDRAYQQHVRAITTRATVPALTATSGDDSRSRVGIAAGLMCACTCTCRVIERR